MHRSELANAYYREKRTARSSYGEAHGHNLEVSLPILQPVELYDSINIMEILGPSAAYYARQHSCRMQIMCLVYIGVYILDEVHALMRLTQLI